MGLKTPTLRTSREITSRYASVTAVSPHRVTSGQGWVSSRVGLAAQKSAIITFLSKSEVVHLVIGGDMRRQRRREDNFGDFRPFLDPFGPEQR